ncbi:MAG: DNA primase [Oligoflexia bacterium]|nr:DNA primase [Oligoflexia bacterium]
MASKEFIQKIKDEIDIVDVVREFVDLRKSGAQYVGLSPFQKEKSPSFFVSPDKQTYYCYSTNQGGDIFTFLESVKGWTFPEALKYLAEKAEIPMEWDGIDPKKAAIEKAQEEEKKILFKLNRFAARYFQEALNGSEGVQARAYTEKRKLSRESLLNFGIGYAPDNWVGLRDYLLKAKAPILKAVELGLLRVKNGEKPKADGSNCFDAFRSRLMFPIRDSRGEILGFGGRWMGAANAEAPKYINSPESKIYHKDRVLFNLDLSRKSARDLGSIILVEGYMDAITLSQSGFSNVVANCGTALTKNQVKILTKISKKVICFYDSDRAGIEAAERAMDLFLDEGEVLLRAEVSQGKDPDEFLRESGPEGVLQLAKILQSSPAAIDLWIENRIQSCPPTLQARAEAAELIVAKLVKIKDEFLIAARVSAVSSSLHVEDRLLINLLNKKRKGLEFASKSVPNQSIEKNTKSSNFLQKNRKKPIKNDKKSLSVESRFLVDLLHYSNWIVALRERSINSDNSFYTLFRDPTVKDVLQKLLSPLVEEETDELRLKSILDEFRENREIRNLIAEAFAAKNAEMPEKELEGALRKLKEELFNTELRALQDQLRQAEGRGDALESESLLKKMILLKNSSRQIHSDNQGQRK